MDINLLLNPVVISVLVMIVLSLLRLNILVSIIIAALVAGLMSGMGLDNTMITFISSMGNNSETALSYILLGALAYSLQESGVAARFGRLIEKKFGFHSKVLILVLALIACFSQNLVPVHIAFIPILIPPLLEIFNKLKIDRRAIACALTFGLQMYLIIPIGFGNLFQGLVATNFNDNIPKEAIGVFEPVMVGDVWKSTWIAGIGLLIGLLVAVFFTYRKKRDYEDIKLKSVVEDDNEKLTKEQWGAIIGAVIAFGTQIVLDSVNLKKGSLLLGALVGLLVMLMFGTIKIKKFDNTINEGVAMMGFVAFVMLVAAGFAGVIRASGGIEILVNSATGVLEGSKLMAIIVLLLIGFLITIGIGTSFGTAPIIATIYTPLCFKLGFSVPATIALIAIAAALGDAGSPASDSTLGPTAGLDIDGQHDHIRDTCIPTIIHFSIPLFIFGVISAYVL